jgi:AraC-like DNA-binding protein
VWINPPPGELGKHNAILSARGRRHAVREFSGPLSIKTVVRGSAVWQAAAGRFELGPGRFLILNDGSPYSLTVESERPVETFCLFFQRGFVESARDAVQLAHAQLLDNPFEPPQGSIGFFERLHDDDPRLRARLAAMRLAVGDGTATPEWLEQQLVATAFDLIALRGEVAREPGRLPAIKAATRAELYRRLVQGRQFLDESYREPLRLADAALAACLSPFHFHRLFREAFGETPHAYLTRRRLARAAQLLEFTGRSVLDICGEAGFQSLGAFSSLFRRRFGQSPRAYRSQHEQPDRGNRK